jgi:hypothetical protein
MGLNHSDLIETNLMMFRLSDEGTRAFSRHLVARDRLL